MNDRHNDPILDREDAPEHGPTFWADLESSMTAARPDAVEATTVMPRVAADATTEMAALRTDQSPAVAAPLAPRQRRSAWPLAAAAALLAILGIGVFALRGTDDGTTAEIVAGPADDAAISLDGPDDADGTSDDTDAANSETSTEPETAPTDTPAPDVDAASGETTPAEPPTVAASGDDGSDAAVVPLPVFDAAPGADGDPLHVPLDQGVPEQSRYLGNWPAASVTWYAVTDPSLTCASPAYSEIRYVNGSGITQPVRDPQLRFSGEISHFAIRAEQNLAAWVSSCGTQLELYVATLTPTGRVEELTLAWLGEGSVSSALVLWEQDEVSLNAIEPGGTAFNVDYNIATELVSRNGGPSRIMLEAGAPAERSLTPLAASSDGQITYWTGTAPAGTVSACSELFGSGVSDTLWLRQGEGQWQLAVVGDVPLGRVTALAIEPAFNQVAFADLCDGGSGRLFLGTQRADGAISNLREIDLTPFVPGFAAQLHWVDSQTLRIETDNTSYGFGTVRFDFRLDDGRENGVIVQLD